MAVFVAGGMLVVLLSATPSFALRVNEASGGNAQFAGDSCGDKDYGVLDLPRRAHGVQVVAPSVGDPLSDDNGNLVAEISKVQMRGHHVVVTARGAYDVCDSPADYENVGWATEPVALRARYKIDRSVVVFSCGNARIKPGQIVIACGDGNYGLERMRWSHRGGRMASGRGRVYANDCNPYCAAGHFHFTPARVRLQRPRYCSTVDSWNYTRMVVRQRGRRRQRIWLGWVCHSGLAGKLALIGLDLVDRR